MAMRKSCLSDFSSSSTIPTATNKFADLAVFAEQQDDNSILIRDFATFIQAIGKVHYLAANPKAREGEGAKEFSDKQWRIFYRGQHTLYGKHHDAMIPTAYRGGDLSKDVEDCVNRVLKLPPFVGTEMSREAIEGLIQQYGGISRWIDVVDNIWIALWFACHRVWVAKDIAETKKAKKYTGYI